VWLASLLAWAYFVRPTNAIPIIAVTVYIFIFYRHLFIQYAATGFVWFALFIIYSWTHFHQLLPNYYLASRLTFNHFGEALAGNLISPARGLFIYVPVLLYGFYLLVRYRKHLAFPALAKLSLVVVLVHWIITSGFPHWWGGYSYGPRLMTGIVPWLVLLVILGIQAMLKAREEQAEGKSLGGWRVQNALGGFLLLLSIFMNGIGATLYATSLWNDKPISVDRQSSRIWDWHYPQFLAGFLGPPPPAVFPPASSRIEFSRNGSQPYLWYGWSVNEEVFRWTDGREAAVIFSVDEITDATLRMKMVPLLVPGKLDAQRVSIELNGQLIETLTLKEAAPLEYSKALPKEMLRQNNVLIFRLPDAASPKSLDLNPDQRTLGIAMFWLEVQTENGGVDNQPRDTTAANSPLPAGGYSADVEPLDAPTAMKPGQEAIVHVRVKNASGAVWAPLGKSDSTYQVRLGNHWLDEKGNVIDLDDARAILPYDLRPGMEIELVLNIKAPDIPGNYTLEFDMVQEHVTWFADEGSRTARTKVTVR
jgi:hypothetical protein